MDTATPSSATATLATTPPLGTVSNSGSDAEHQSKLRTLIGVLRRFIGVADLAAVRFSLPSQLLEPVPNLEYWNYLDRPETFASIGDSDSELGRFLGVLRFWFTKDLKFVKGKPCKPYNSTLGEFFRVFTRTDLANIGRPNLSFGITKRTYTFLLPPIVSVRCNWDVQGTLPLLETSSRSSQLSARGTPPPTSTGDASVRVSYLTEQTSHHPPVSAFYIDCPAKGVSANGYDQISAKFTGTAIKVSPGVHNLGIFITLHNHGEQYRLTHPAAHLGGFLRGTLAVYVEDVAYITCRKTKLRCILQYIGDSWIGKAKHRVEGVVYRYETEKEEGYERIKDVSSSQICARIEGSWVNKVYYTVTGSSEKHPLIDLEPLFPILKSCPPRDLQLPNESRVMWEGVSEAIHTQDYSRATQLKHEIEEQQREKAAARKQRGTSWKPKFFEDMHERIGQPHLSNAGRLALDGLAKGDYKLEAYNVD